MYIPIHMNKFRLCMHRSDHTSPESGMDGDGHQREWWRGWVGGWGGAQYYLFKNTANLHIHAGWYHTSETNAKLESTTTRLMLGTVKFQPEILTDKFTQAVLNDISGKVTVEHSCNNPFNHWSTPRFKRTFISMEPCKTIHTCWG